MQKSISDIEKEIEQKKKEIANLQKREKYMQSLSPQAQVAITLHSLLCNYNHTDGCSWYYEMESFTKIDNWHGSAHQEYYRRASNLCNKAADLGIELEDVITIIKLARGNNV